ncbi:hypothetical protein [Corynebacterium sp. AOP12-C2-36]|uniref:hypothetical protein n=1 Tax=Corynebacterium sp. AOP12-C2-36 TaxID=3457723 RepID=UPI0040333784
MTHAKPHATSDNTPDTTGVHRPEPAQAYPVAAAPGSPETQPQLSTTGRDEQPSPVWIALGKLVIGVAVIIAALAWSQHFDTAMDRFGYIPVIFVYIIIMIIGGALMVTGFTAFTLDTRDNRNTRDNRGLRDSRDNQGSRES